MLTFDDEGGRGSGASPDGCSERLEALGVYRREQRPWLPHLTVAPLPRAAAPPTRRSRSSATVVPSDAAVFISRSAPGRGAVRGLRSRSPSRRLMEVGSRASSGRRPRADRAQLRQGRGDEDERPGAGLGRRHLDRIALARPRARHRRPAARPGRRDLRPRVVGQDDPRLPRDRRGPAPRRHLRLHRRRARDGPDLRASGSASTSTSCSSPSPTPASRRSRSPSSSIRSGALVGGRDRLGRRADAEGRDRGRDGRLPRRPAGAADVAGAAQARRHAQPHRDDLHLHEPAAREDRRHVRQPRDHAGRPGAQVLRLGAARHPPHRDAQGRRRGDRQPRAA